MYTYTQSCDCILSVWHFSQTATAPVLRPGSQKVLIYRVKPPLTSHHSSENTAFCLSDSRETKRSNLIWDDFGVATWLAGWKTGGLMWIYRWGEEEQLIYLLFCLDIINSSYSYTSSKTTLLVSYNVCVQKQTINDLTVKHRDRYRNMRLRDVTENNCSYITTPEMAKTAIHSLELFVLLSNH